MRGKKWRLQNTVVPEIVYQTRLQRLISLALKSLLLPQDSENLVSVYVVISGTALRACQLQPIVEVCSRPAGAQVKNREGLVKPAS